MSDILVIDDTPQNLELLASILQKKGYKVRSVTKGSAGIRGAKASPPDLILLDVKMPQMDGYEVCRQLKANEKTREVPVIFISALEDVIDKVKAFQVGGVDYITKPFQVEEVLARIEAHLTIRQLQTRLQNQNIQLQNEIRERMAAEEKFTKAFQMSPSPIAITTLKEGKFLEVNPSFEQLSGYCLKELLNYQAKDFNLGFTSINELEQQENIYNKELTFPTASGEDKTVLLSLEKIELEGVSCTLNIINDITERKRLENEFISLVSHELRTPMNAMIGALDLLGTGQLGDLNEQGQKLLKIATTNTERLIDLVNDILDLERMKSGKIILHKVKSNLAELINEVIESLESIANEKELTIIYESLNIEVFVDPDRMIQVFTNLLSNAMKFSDFGQSIWIRTQLNPNQIYIEIEDQGRGIPPNKIQQIFEPFQQVDVSDSRQKGGTGLGLAICRQIIEQHEGRIWVQSSSKNGSIFKLILPY